MDLIGRKVIQFHVKDVLPYIQTDHPCWSTYHQQSKGLALVCKVFNL